MHTVTLQAQEPMAPGIFSDAASDTTSTLATTLAPPFLLIIGVGALMIAVFLTIKMLLSDRSSSPAPPIGALVFGIALMMMYSTLKSAANHETENSPKPTPDQTPDHTTTPSPAPPPDQTPDHTTTPSPAPPPDPAPKSPPADYSNIWHVIAIIAAIIGITIAVLVLGYILRLITRALITARRARRERTAKRTGAWESAQHLWFVLQAEYTEAETNPKLVLEYPLLTDISVPQTADFHKAFAKVRNLDHKTVPGTQEEVDAFADAVHDARIAFDTAMAHARLKGVSTFTSDQQRKLAQARKALDLALDDNASASERQAALDKVVALTSGIILLPTKATKPLVIELETARRKELTA